MKIMLVLIIQSFLLPVEDRIQVTVPTVEEETEYVWRTIADINFFEEHNYEISLPQGDLIEELKQKAKLNQLTDEDYQQLEQYMRSTIYQKTDYEKGYRKIESNKALLNKMINEIGAVRKDWHYKEFKQYEVKLTLYGPGGSYDPETGSILIYTTKEGAFKQYDNPSNTIIHEIVHIGTEASIMNKYNIPHPLKERIIDNIVLINFKEDLPEYRLQTFGDSRIDAYLKNKRSIKRLDKIVERFQREFVN
ncbi:MAG: hypothetical protein MI974_25120 [Chitinophagales bacterium]|nr:hypothetical protein [Chitinophagales bacterium]